MLVHIKKNILHKTTEGCMEIKDKGRKVVEVRVEVIDGLHDFKVLKESTGGKLSEIIFSATIECPQTALEPSNKINVGICALHYCLYITIYKFSRL